MTTFPQTRLRRLRQSPQIRQMMGTPLPGPERFIWPIFVRTGTNIKEPIDSMPGQYRWSIDRLPEAIDTLLAQGVNSVLIFGLPDLDSKSSDGIAATFDDGIVQQAVLTLTQHYPELMIFTDVCLCAYTSHGHCGPLSGVGQVDNDEANLLLTKVAISHANAGAHAVAPSAMMDGQIAALRNGLDSAGFQNTILMSYSTKFASAMYGPFRDAEQSSPQDGDRKGYQADYSNLKQAMRESVLDEDEGADILMVKPSLFYLDIVARLSEITNLPLAVYNVSGEYSMLIATADRGWGDLRDMVQESTAALARSGADIIISYWADRYKEMFT